jgi:hypothetical protein
MRGLATTFADVYQYVPFYILLARTFVDRSASSAN